MTGKVYLVGAGPGHPDLLTLRALRVMQEADLVLYDRLVGEGILALVNPDARCISVGKEPGRQQETQERIFRLMEGAVHLGETVVRLKGGDPMVFGRGGEEWMFLAERGIDVEVVPGITSAIAVPALAGIPLTYRGVASSFSVVAGRGNGRTARDWVQHRTSDTLVVLMGVETRRHIARRLIKAGRPAGQAVAFIERGTTATERVTETTLAEVAAGRVEVAAPAVMVVGEVVGLRPHLTARGGETQPEVVGLTAAEAEAAS